MRAGALARQLSHPHSSPGAECYCPIFQGVTTKTERNHALDLTSTTCPVSHRAGDRQSLNLGTCDSEVPCPLSWEAPSRHSFPQARSGPSRTALGIPQ